MHTKSSACLSSSQNLFWLHRNSHLLYHNLRNHVQSRCCPAIPSNIQFHNMTFLKTVSIFHPDFIQVCLLVCFPAILHLLPCLLLGEGSDLDHKEPRVLFYQSLTHFHGESLYGLGSAAQKRTEGR